MFLESPNSQDADDLLTGDAAGRADVVIEALGADAVAVPGGEAVLKGEFLREGDDLLIEAADGQTVLIENFFADGATPDLVVGGAVVPGRITARLTRDEAEPDAGGDDVLIGGNEEDLLGVVRETVEPQEAALPAQDPAQETAREPVAEVTEAQGQVIVQRADGSRFTAEPGTRLFEDDVVTTDEGGSVGITFVDGMSFSLGEQARLLLDEFKYDPENHEGGGLLSVLQGQFSFVSGAAAHTAEDALMIETPTMTIGVRGTKVVAHAGAEGEVSRIALLAEENGRVGKIMVTTDQGSQLISEANMMVEVVSRFEAPSPQVALSSDQVFDYFNSAISVLPAPAEFFNPERPERPTNDSDGASFARPGQAAESSQPAAQEGPQAPAETALAGSAAVTVSPVSAPQSSSQSGPTGSESQLVAEVPSALESLMPAAAPVAEAPASSNDLPPPSNDTPPASDSGAPLGNGGLAPPEPVSTAPSVVAPLANQATAEDAAYLLDASTAFADPGDTLTFSATLVGGGPLPAWLSFNPTTGVLSGTPVNGDVGNLDLEVTATDSSGQTAVSSYQLTVSNSNDAPTASGIANTPATEDSAFAYDVSGSFSDVDLVHGDSLTFSAELLGGGTLPSWLSIDAGTGVLSGTPANGDVGAIDVKVTATDGAGAQASSNFQLTIANVNDAPTVVSTIADMQPTQGMALAHDVSGYFADIDSIHGDNLTFSATQVGGAPLPGWLSIDGITGVLSGTPGVPDIGVPIDVEITATDGSGASVSTSFTVTVDATNLAPVLSVTGSPTLTAIAEDAATPAGNTVAEIVIDGSISDADGVVEAIAVTGVDDTNGTWEYSTDGGSTFNAIGAVSDNSALLLDAAAMIRFVPSADYNGNATFTYRAWDQTSGASGNTGVDVSTNGGVTAFSTATETAAITITAVNDAPVLDNTGSPTLTAIAEDTASPAGDTVASIVIDGSITDVDGLAPEAIAVTAVDDTNGTWEYSTDGGSTFNAIGAVSDSSALLLGPSALVRFVPSADFNGNATFTYRAWDQTSGASGDSGVDTSVGTAFSAASEVAGITVTPNYDAPVLDTSGNPSLTAIAEDSADPAGNTVAEIVLDGSITDPDGPAVEAMAVTGVDDTNGTWEYSTDGGTTFTAIGAVSDSSALLLDATAKIRFVPNADYNGSATFTYRAWDQRLGSNGDTGVDVSTNGGSTPYSAATETAAITITAVNDAPVLDNTGSPTLTTILANTAAPAGDTVADIVIDGSITDVDGAAPEAIAVTGVDNTNGTWEYSTDGVNFSSINAVSDSSALLLSASAKIRFVPDASYQGSASFTYKAWDQSTGSNGDSGVDTTVGTAFSSASEVAAISVAPVGSAPVVAGGNVLDFAGTNSFIDVGDPGGVNGDLDLGTGDLTVEAWFYYDGSTSGGQQTIASKYNQSGSKEGYSIFLDNGELVVRVNSTGSNADADTAASSINLAGNEGWYHVAMVINQEAGTNASMITGYLNGSSAGWTAGFDSAANDRFTMDGAGTDTDKSFMIGAVDNGPNQTKYFDGQIADVRVWDKARTSHEITTDMARMITGDQGHLIANWHLDEGSGTLATNSVSGGIDGAISGGPSWLSSTSLTTTMNEEIHGRLTATDAEGDTLSFSVSSGASNGTATINASTGAWEYDPNLGFTGADNFSYQISDGNGGTEVVNISVVVV